MREGHELRSLVYNRVRVWRPPTNTSVPNFPWVPTPPPPPRDGFCIGAVESLTTVLIWDACNWKYYIEIYFWASKVACFIPNLERTIHFLMKLQAYSCRKRKLQCAEKITVKILTRAYDVRFGKELNWELTNYPRKLKMSLMTMQMITKDSYMVQTVQQRKVQNAQCANLAKFEFGMCTARAEREKPVTMSEI